MSTTTTNLDAAAAEPGPRTFRLRGPVGRWALPMLSTAARPHARRATIVELSEAEIVDREALAAIGALADAAGDADRRLVVTGLSPAAREVLRIDALIDGLRQRQPALAAG